MTPFKVGDRVAIFWFTDSDWNGPGIVRRVPVGSGTDDNIYEVYSETCDSVGGFPTSCLSHILEGVTYE